ncbi:MAG: hypothetical protein AAFU73_22815 [Planctomycetota bacterium]
MSIHVTCAACGASYNVAEEHAGKRAKCKECGAALQIPALSGEDPGDEPSEGAERATRPTVQRRSSRGGRAGGSSRARREESEWLPDVLTPAAVGAGFGTAVVGAALWYFVGRGIDREIGWVAIGVGALIGFVMKCLGALGFAAGAVAASLTLFAILVGKAFLYSWWLGQLDIEFAADVSMVELVMQNFEIIDLVFLGIGAAAAFGQLKND